MWVKTIIHNEQRKTSLIINSLRGLPNATGRCHWAEINCPFRALPPTFSFRAFALSRLRAFVRAFVLLWELRGAYHPRPYQLFSVVPCGELSGGDAALGLVEGDMDAFRCAVEAG